MSKPKNICNCDDMKSFLNSAMALTWPTTFDIFHAINNQCNYNKNLDFRKKTKKMGEIKAIDLNATKFN